MFARTIAELEASLHPDRAILSRVQAIKGLWLNPRSPKALSLLGRALQDPVSMIRRRALEALTSIGTPEAMRIVSRKVRAGEVPCRTRKP